MNTKETCCKCGKGFGEDGVAAWDGNDNEACWKCFGTYGWKAFPVAPTPEELHASFFGK